jgi:hypothetical protein
LLLPEKPTNPGPGFVMMVFANTQVATPKNKTPQSERNLRVVIDETFCYRECAKQKAICQDNCQKYPQLLITGSGNSIFAAIKRTHCGWLCSPILDFFWLKDESLEDRQGSDVTGQTSDFRIDEGEVRDASVFFNILPLKN